MSNPEKRSRKETLKIYADEIKKLPLLSDKELAELSRKARLGDKDAFNKIVEHNLRLVLKIANQFSGLTDMPLEDLVQEGNIGLMEAVKRFDPDKGYKFATYATWWIRQNIQRAIIEKSPTIRIPSSQLEIMKKVSDAEIFLARQKSAIPSDDDIAKSTGLTLKQVKTTRRLLRQGHYNFVLDKSMTQEEENEDMLNFLVDPDPTPDQEIIQDLIKEYISQKLDRLTEVEKKILILRFGLADGRSRTLKEIANKLGKTRERIRQIEKKALSKIKAGSIKEGEVKKLVKSSLKN